MGLGSLLKEKLGDRDAKQPPPQPPVAAGEKHQPPPGPPPGHGGANPAAQAPYHDWTAVPDTSELPPPPALRHEASPTSNAPCSEAEAAIQWFQRHPMAPPRQLTEPELETIQQGTVRLTKPREFTGDLFSRGTLFSRQGVWAGRSWSGCRDACLTSNLPLYAAQHHAPQAGANTNITIYYEVRVLGIGRDVNGEESSLALGYSAQPYPSWRLPGWGRGSLAVHGDDGHRFVNDDQGGKDFTTPFRKGDTVGLGMTFTAPPLPPPPAYDFVDKSLAQQPAPSTTTPAGMRVEIFFTRNGQREEGWDLHEERDQSAGGIEGLDGQHDLYPAVGVFGGVDFEVVFERSQWAYTMKS